MTSKVKSVSSHSGFVPEWMTFEVQQALSKIRDPHATKKQMTVLHLAEAAALGTPMAEVFRRPDTCTEKVWHGWTDKATGKRRRGWKLDATIARALAVATERARWWMLVRQGQAVQTALDTLTAAAPDVAKQLVSIATQGRAAAVFEGGPVFVPADVKDIIKAADSILDRVSDKTADKGAAATSIKMYTVMANPDMWDDENNVDTATLAGGTVER
jgi:hypothetical protein